MIHLQNVHVSMAKRLCADANERAQLGGKVMTEAVAAMKTVGEYSGRISQATVLIDEIALRTNLLALDTLVRLAGTGAQTQDFSALAEEVGALARRTAIAAREIKKLIVESAASVDSGMVLVSQSGMLFDEIVVAVDKVEAMINDAM